MSKDKAPREAFLKIIQEWKWYWMNQTQNSEADYLNYQSRAHGIDANMKYDLADRLATRETALEAKLAEKEVELLGLKEGLEHLKYSVEQCSLAANVYRSKLAECVAAIQYVMANNDKIKGWDKLHDAFYGAKK